MEIGRDSIFSVWKCNSIRGHGNGLDLSRILNSSSPFIIYILIPIGFRFFIPTSMEDRVSIPLPKYHILICEMNCFRKL